jgi:hypothetical protein
MIRIIGHHLEMSKRMGGSQPRLDRRKRIPNPIRMYAPIADLDLMTPPMLCWNLKPGEPHLIKTG